MRIITCKKCGAKVSDEFSNCTNCQAPINPKIRTLATKSSRIEQASRSSLMGWLLSPLDPSRRPKRKISSKTRQGALVGAFVGLIYGIVTAIYVDFVALPVIMSALTALEIESPQALTILPSVSKIITAIVIVGAPLVGIVEGAVVGALFVVFMRRIPGSSIIRKSVVFSFVLLGISIVIGFRGYFDPRISMLDRATLTAIYSLRAGSFALVLVEYPLLGYLFGYLVDRRLRPT